MNQATWVKQLEKKLTTAGRPGIARGQAQYMRNKFEFLGVMTPKRREIFRHFIKAANVHDLDLRKLATELWGKTQREFQYCAIGLTERALRKEVRSSDLKLLVSFIRTKSWWDTVDALAPSVGTYFKKHPDQTWSVCDKWIKSDFLWLQRTTLIFQLKYKKQTDTKLLYDNIKRLAPIDEFFIQKAIGWSLREYSKTNPKSVREFILRNNLSNLAVREGSKYLT